MCPPSRPDPPDAPSPEAPSLPKPPSELPEADPAPVPLPPPATPVLDPDVDAPLPLAMELPVPPAPLTLPLPPLVVLPLASPPPSGGGLVPPPQAQNPANARHTKTGQNRILAPLTWLQVATRRGCQPRLKSQMASFSLDQCTSRIAANYAPRA